MFYEIHCDRKNEINRLFKIHNVIENDLRKKFML